MRFHNLLPLILLGACGGDLLEPDVEGGADELPVHLSVDVSRAVVGMPTVFSVSGRDDRGLSTVSVEVGPHRETRSLGDTVAAEQFEVELPRGEYAIRVRWTDSSGQEVRAEYALFVRHVRLSKTAGVDQWKPAGSELDEVAVRVEGPRGPVAGMEVEWRVLEGGGAVAPTFSRTDSLGRVSVMWRLGDEEGVNRLLATAGGEEIVFEARAVGEEREVASRRLAAGEVHTCALDAAGRAWCWGGNHAGQLGDGTTEGALSPQPVGGGLTFRFIDAREHNTCGLTPEGRLYCWGESHVRLPGSRGREGHLLEPTPVGGELRLSEIALGDFLGCGSTRIGRIYCWGEGFIGDRAHSPEPTLIPGPHAFEQIDAAGRETCGLTAGGRTFCWGRSPLGRRVGHETDRPAPLEGAPLFVELLLAGGHACGLTGDGRTFCWGSGWLGLPEGESTSPIPVEIPSASPYVAISGRAHTCGVTAAGDVECWGENTRGELGSGTWAAEALPHPVASLSGVKDLVTGAMHTCALDRQERLYCWGWNGSGQLGNGQARWSAPVRVASSRFFTSLSAGDRHTCALAEDGSAWCFGSSGNGQGAVLGHGEPEPSSVPVKVRGDRKWKSLDAGRLSCALDEPGSSWCWGYVTAAELGYDDGTAFDGFSTSEPWPVETEDRFVDLTVGSSHACGVREDGNAVCWGSNSSGQLGNGEVERGSPRSPPAPVVVDFPEISALAAAFDRTCALLTEGGVGCWGGDRNFFTAGLLADTDDIVSLGAGGLTVCGIDAQAQLDCSLEDSSASPGPGIRAADVAPGLGHSCLVTPEATVACWGENAHGELGFPPDGREHPDPVPVIGVAGALKVATGMDHSCALLEDGSIMCWGFRGWGNLGNGLPAASLTPELVEGF